MTFSIEGKTALVTGANRGIGKGFVEVLLGAGAATIYAAARNLDDLTDVIALNPSVIRPMQLDVTSDADIHAACEALSTLDILVNNAGVVLPIDNSAPDALRHLKQEMAVNCFGPMALTNGLLPVLKQSEQAAIINISSIAGIANYPSIGTYSISKAALHSYTQGLRAELAKDRIAVLGVYPGPTDTRMAEGFDMDKPAPETVAIKAFDSLSNGEGELYPDDFAKNMYAVFAESPSKLVDTFASL